MIMKFGILKKDRRKKKKKHSKRKGSVKVGTEEEPCNNLRQRYFALEREIAKEWDKDSLEKQLNDLLQQCPEYGNVCLKINKGKILIYKEEIFNDQIDHEYFVKFMEDSLYVSTEQTIKDLKQSKEIVQSCQLVDVAFYSIYRILIFRK